MNSGVCKTCLHIRKVPDQRGKLRSSNSRLLPCHFDGTHHWQRVEPRLETCMLFGLAFNACPTGIRSNDFTGC